MNERNATEEQRTPPGQDARLPDVVGSLRSQEESARIGASVKGLIFSIIILVVGIFWAAAEQGARERWYVGHVVPVSWFFIGSGVIGIIGSILISWSSKTRDTPDVSVGMDGIKTGDGLIKWDEIDRVYVGGTTTRVNFSTTSDQRFIKVFAKDGREADVDVDFAGKMNETASKTFGAIHAAILSRVSQRQWDEFITRIKSGEVVRFSPALYLRGDGIISANFNKGEQLLPFESVCGMAIKDGDIRLDYVTEKVRQKTISLGPVGTTANIHILQAFLDHVVEVNQGKGKGNRTGN